MLKSELEQIIANGENSGVEFKRDDCRPEQLAKEIIAMVNLNGGMVLLGVEDDGTISGIQRKNLDISRRPRQGTPDIGARHINRCVRATRSWPRDW